MKLPLSWLKEFIPVELDPGMLSERLSMAGLEVEAVERLSPAFSGVVTAKVLRVEHHPNAERLSVCEVDNGSGHFSVVCGAPNVRPGMVSALAMVGARLAPQKGTVSTGENGATLQAAVIRGIKSEGMLCSERELGLFDNHRGIVELPDDAPVGRPLEDYLQLNDHVLDVAVTPNRGDCLSILGLAREVAALLGHKLKLPRIKPPAIHQPRRTAIVPAPSAAVEITAPDLCPRYAALPVAQVKISESPLWLKQRLKLCGLRPVNNVVDVTNYVMLELGQPLHAFDLDRLRQGRIIVRRAGHDRELETLDHTRRTLVEDDLVIADGDGPVALAGLMGGTASEVSDDTTRLLLESAFFEAAGVARTSHRLGLVTEASYRFERGVDRQGQVVALWRAAHLLRKVAGDCTLGAVIDVEPRPQPAREIEFSTQLIAGLLGATIARDEAVRRLRSLGIGVKPAGKGCLVATIPSFRPDLREAADISEEVARIAGLADIPTLPFRPLRDMGDENQQRQLLAALRLRLADCGLSEVKTLAFAPPQDNRVYPGLTHAQSARIANPLSAELSELRKSLICGLIGTLRFNLYREAQACHLFEMGKVFYQELGELKEAERLGALSYGELAFKGLGERGRMADFFTLKGAIEACLDALGLGTRIEFVRLAAEHAPHLHPGKAAEVRLDNGESLGHLGELHPELALHLEVDSPVVLCELDVDKLIAYGSLRKPVAPPPRFPAVRRDLALVLDRDFPVAQVRKAIAQADVSLLESVELFDVYEGDSLPIGKKSVAVTCRYRARDRTLTDEEVNQLHAKITAFAIERLGALLR
jgi:phenylalanyl-tRNA synthetase beta chain